jgi:hypothetical protein
VRPIPIQDSLRSVLHWYFAQVYGRHEGPGISPFFCDPKQVGLAAVDPELLARGDSTAVFKLFVAMAMYQARRDVVIMAQQRSFTAKDIDQLMSPNEIQTRLQQSSCPCLGSEVAFSACSVRKVGSSVTCVHAEIPCLVRTATQLLNRLGDHGKLPVSAYYMLGQPGALPLLLAEAVSRATNPISRAAYLVSRLAQVHRVGEKLATMFVSSLSTPALYPSTSPWFPQFDGNELVVVDTHAARMIDRLRPSGAVRTYQGRANWLRKQAHKFDLRLYAPGLPRHSPRLVQQALYAYGSRSNRVAWELSCQDADCAFALCPFHGVAPSRDTQRP